MKVSVIGLGHVGSVTAAGLAALEHDVTGIDTDASKVAAYQSNTVPIYEPGLSDLIKTASQHGKLRFVHDSEVSGPLGDIIVIATGTPTKATGAADLSQVVSALRWVKHRQPGHGVVVMKSTVPPGTGERLSSGLLKKSGLTYVANPEFLREGQAISDWFHPDRIVIGMQDEATLPLLQELYRGIEAPLVVTDLSSAEMVKYASNAFLATKISFINEIANLCDKVGASIDQVSYGVSLDPRIGPSFLKAGVGYGGSCFPKDIRALDYLGLANDHHFEVLRSVITVNNRQRLLPLYSLRQCFGNLLGVKVAVLGLAFKPNTDDVREAPAIDLIKGLDEEGATVTAYDPQAMSNAAALLPEDTFLASDLEECVDRVQALVLMTEWPEIVEADWDQIAGLVEPPRFLFDGRNALDPARMRDLGFTYFGVGRKAALATTKTKRRRSTRN